MRKYLRLSYVGMLLLGCALSSCGIFHTPFYSREARDWRQQAPKDTADLAYSLFLIGDVGKPSTNEQEPSLKLLQKQLEAADTASAVVFLGDNIYQYGMSPEGASGRKEDERRINEQLKILKNFKGEKYMIPGNHDWANGKPRGFASALRQEAYVEQQVPSGNFFVPDDGCPGPFEALLADNLVIIALNTQWWLHENEKPYGPNNYCGVDNELDMLVQLESILERHKEKHIVVVGHHPCFTNGFHGGYFTIKDHLFPLTIVKEWAYIPLPIIGSIYPVSRMFGSSNQDIAGPRYTALRDGLLAVFAKFPNLVYAAGHEHNLQYFKNNEQHYIVSGSGCKQNHARGGHKATYTQRIKGFARVQYYKNGEVWVEYWNPEGDGGKGNLTFRYPLYAKLSSPVTPAPEAELPAQEYRDSTITIAANARYRAGDVKALLLGHHYRKEWRTPVKMPYLDLGHEHGGLVPYKKGGGKQTASLKLRNEEDHQFKLRSINKDPSQVLPDALRETFARDLLQDQISAQHPYSALMVPRLADAAGVYHTNPKLVFVPNDPRLRQWIDEFGRTVGYLEEDVDENHESVASLGYSRNLVGTDKVLEDITRDNDYRINEQAYARARLLDMLIGDWDRHEGQWRWTYTKTEKGRIYEPIPQDRDIAFFKADGFFPWLSRRKWAIRNFQNFGYDYDDYLGLNLSAIDIDRTMLGSVTKEQWVDIATRMKQSVTDQAIEAAVHDMPPEVFPFSGPEIIAKLKSRRDLLPQVAADYYEVLNREVDVRGTHKHERFEINRLDNDRTEVKVFKTSKEGEVREQIFHRVFDRHTTNVIRLYGMGGRDQFEVTGKVKKGIKLRIIGGEGEDRIVDKSKVAELGHQTVVYDDRNEKNEIDLGTEAREKTSDDPEVNNYDRLGYKFTYVGPLASFYFNIDDGLFLGGGAVVRFPGFRKKPYGSEHRLIANKAIRSEAYNIRYNGDFKQIMGVWNLSLPMQLYGPQFLFNYFGQGNETTFQEGSTERDDIGFYRVKFSRFLVNPTLYRNFSSFFTFGIGPSYDRFKVERTPDRFIVKLADSTNAGEQRVPQDVFDVNEFVGARLYGNLEAVTNPVNPRLGLKWLNEISYNYRLNGGDKRFTRLSSEAIVYISPQTPFQITTALRVGGAHNIGDYLFYQSNFLGGAFTPGGGDANLRGYRRTRFAGRSSLYANAELRLEVFKFNVYLFPGKVGVLGLADFGRVYADKETSKKIHRGYGGGVWVDILKQVVLTGTYAVGEKENLTTVSFGFLF